MVQKMTTMRMRAPITPPTFAPLDSPAGAAYSSGSLAAVLSMAPAAQSTDAERLQAFRDVRDQLSALLPRELCRR